MLEQTAINLRREYAGRILAACYGQRDHSAELGAYDDEAVSRAIEMADRLVSALREREAAEASEITTLTGGDDSQRCDLEGPNGRAVR